MAPNIKSQKKKVRRGRGFLKKCSNKSFKIIGNNAAGLKGKKDSFIVLLDDISAGVAMIQETKLYRKGTMRFNNYLCFEKVRGEGEGGGLMTLVHNSLNPVYIPTKSESKISENIMVVEARLKDKSTRFINAYGVQETASIEDKSNFYSVLDEEISLTLDSGNMLWLELDANAKFGKQIIKNDPHDMSGNGKMLLDLVDRHNLVIVNATDKCIGTITRMKKVRCIIEQSVLDYFIVCQNFYSFIISMKIDEERKNVLTKFVKTRGKSCKIESDHNPMILEVNISWSSKISAERTEIYNLKNKDCHNKFYEYTNNTKMLTNCLINTDVRSGGKLWLKNFKFAIMQTFKKVRINRTQKNKVNKDIEELFVQRRLGDGPDIASIEEDLANKIFERNKQIIVDQVANMTDNACNLSRIKMWKIKQKVCPKQEVSYPVAKLNQKGDMVSNRSELKDLSVNTYKERLKHRDIEPGYSKLRELKEGLFDLRIKLSKVNKSENWTQKDLLIVTKQLKCNKAADPKGIISEILKPGVAGKDLFDSLLVLCNMVKEECEIPTFMQWTNISSIYKNRGLKTDLANDRGVFNVIKTRAVIDNLIYNDYYETIDRNMSDSNVGGRRERNIRDNLFVLYGIICPEEQLGG